MYSLQFARECYQLASNHYELLQDESFSQPRVSQIKKAHTKRPIIADKYLQFFKCARRLAPGTLKWTKTSLHI